MQKVFVSHPLSRNPDRYLAEVELRCQELKDKNMLPISPLHLFSFIREETAGLRKEILKVCERLLDIADKAIFYLYDNKLSSGQCYELRYCIDNDIPFEFISVRS